MSIPETVNPLTFKTRDYGIVRVEKRQYADGRPAVKLVGVDRYPGEPIGTLSVCPHSNESLGPGEFFAKAYAENKQIAVDALASGLFVDTGKRIALSPWAEAQVWRWVDASHIVPKEHAGPGDISDLRGLGGGAQ